MLLTPIRPDGSIMLGEQAWSLGYLPGQLVRVVRTSADTLIVALHDEPVLTDATATRLPAAPSPRALTRQER